MSGVNAAVGWHEQIAGRFAEGYQRSPVFRERLAVWTALIAAHVRSGDEVLDAGCGAGTLSFVAAARGAKVLGIDGSAAMIAIAERERDTRELDITFRAAMTDWLDDQPAEHFDVLLSSSVLEYVDDIDAELARLGRMLKPGGTLIVSLPNGDALYRKLERIAFATTGRPRYYEHVRHVLPESKLRGRLAAAGLTTSEVHFFADPPLPGVVKSVMGGARRRKTLVAAVAVKAADIHSFDGATP